MSLHHSELLHYANRAGMNVLAEITVRSASLRQNNTVRQSCYDLLHTEDQSLSGMDGWTRRWWWWWWFAAEAVMCFHWGVLTLGKCNRLEYQADVPQSVTAHLLSESRSLSSDKH